MNKRIIFPFVGDSFGGSHKSSILLIKHLKSLGFDTHVVLHSSGKLIEEQLKIHDIEYSHLKLNALAGDSPNVIRIFFNLIRNMKKISMYIIKNQPDIVHGNDLRINLSWGLITRLTGKKFVWHQRTVLSGSLKWKALPILANHFIAISNFVLSSFPKNIKPNKQSVIYNPIELRPKKDSSNITNDFFKILYLGRVVPEKSVEIILELASELSKRNYQFKINIVGNGEPLYIRSLESMSQELNISKYVEFKGFSHFPEEQIYEADCLISPCENEGLGRAVLEAMSCETVVIAADSGAHKEIIQHKKNGFLFLPNCLDDLIRHVDYVMSNDTQDIIRNAKRFCDNNFSINNHIRNIKDVYNSLI